MNTAILQEPESSVSSKDLDDTGHAQDLDCSKDKCSENQTSENIQSPGSDIVTERAILLDVFHQTDIGSDDNSFEFPEINGYSNCKPQPRKSVELTRCSRCQITKYSCSVDCKKKDWDFHMFACSVVAK